jgi:Fe2+ transport system protein FeoA
MVKREKPANAPDSVPEACAGPALCPLSAVKAGTTVCVRQLATSPEICDRLREMGLREDQHVRLVSRQDSVICQVCNARVALSQKLADVIMVEPVTF